VTGIARRIVLGLALALVAGVAAASAAVDPVMRPEPGDMAIGNPWARVIVIEYGSVGCPHCAVWANTVFPAFKAKYVDTGQVRFVVREMTTGEPDLAAAGFILARCAGPSKYFEVVDTVYERQAEMFQPGAVPSAILKQIGEGAGLSDARVAACLADQHALDALNARVKHHVEVDKVDSTPTFIVNGQRLVGEQTLDQLAAAIATAKGHR
jgi:protein-disulfide isomerase